jgi:hypothetical protein
VEVQMGHWKEVFINVSFYGLTRTLIGYFIDAIDNESYIVKQITFFYGVPHLSTAEITKHIFYRLVKM